MKNLTLKELNEKVRFLESELSVLKQCIYPATTTVGTVPLDASGPVPDVMVFQIGQLQVCPHCSKTISQ